MAYDIMEDYIRKLIAKNITIIKILNKNTVAINKNIQSDELRRPEQIHGNDAC